MKSSFLKFCAFNKVKALLIVALSLISLNAFAYVDGRSFTNDRLINGLTWNASAGRMEFKVMFFDTYGSAGDEFIQSANLYINGVKMATISRNGCRYIATGNNARKYGNIYISGSSSSSYTLTTSALGRFSSGDCGRDDYYIPPTPEKPLKFEEYNVSSSYWYTYPTEKGDNSNIGWSNDVDYGFIVFYLYMNEMTSNRTVTVELKDIFLFDANGQGTLTKSNVSKSESASIPSRNLSISGGTIGSSGKMKVTCNAGTTSAIQLYINGYYNRSGNGSSVEFEDYFPAIDDNLLDGLSFSFKATESVSGGKTKYVRESSTLKSQRTGVFYGNLNASLETCGKVKLRWQIKHPSVSSSSDVNTSGFILQMKKGSGNWTNINTDNIIDGVPPYTHQNGGIKEYSCTYKIPDGELNNGTVKYYFRVKRAFVDQEEYKLKGSCQRETDMDINTDFKQLTEIEIKPGGASGYPLLSWKMTTDGIECSDGISLKLKLYGGGGSSIEKTIPKDSIIKGSYQTSSGDGVGSCVSQSYELILQYGTLPSTTYLVSNNYVYEAAGKREFEKITVSKGYYADRNNIKWYLRNDYDEFNRFRIMRKEAGAPDDEYTILTELTHTPGILQYNYDDRDINAGVYYTYKIEGIYECSAVTGSIPSPVSVGFSQPYGSVSGRVTYTGSQAVRNVEIKVATDNTLNSNRELEFNSERTGSLVSIPAGTKLFSAEGFSFEAWLKFLSSSTEQTLLSNSLLTVKRGMDNKIAVTLANGSTVTVPENIPVGEYVHLALTVGKQSDKNYAVTVYINDSAYITANVTLSSDAVTPVAATKLGETFIGYMDDVRVWSKVLTAEEVALSYDRILGGKETGLAAYYKFDEIDAAESALFDGSATGTTFNGNHAEKGAGVARATVPLSASHLTIKGVTDENGNYSIINSIPYTSEGTTYTLSPALGIHQFDPNNRPLYFSPDSRVFNNIDFTDISSFPVSGQVMYAGSNYPVEGVQIAIDGIAASKDGKVIETGADGTFTVDVPIGSHFISLSKQGHTFVDGGRFPANELEKYNFQTSLSGLTFFDNTTVRLVGRVAGGQPQTDLPLGFGLSAANIGQATITLKTDNDVYRLNLTGADSTVTTTLPKGETSAVTFKNPAAGSVIEIKTNAVTGEFLAVLPPVPYSVTGIETKGFKDTFTDGDETDFSLTKMTFDINPNVPTTLEYTDAGGSYALEVHDSVKITRYSDPVIEVSDLSNKHGAFGDSVYVYTNPATGDKDTVRLYTVTGGTVNYALGVPVLNQKTRQYDWNIKVYERYVNSDGAEEIEDLVPLKEQEITVSNALASERVDFEYIDPLTETVNWDKPVLTESNTTLALDSTGSRVYSFVTGFPNIAGNNQLGASLSFSVNGKVYNWTMNGIVLGQIPSAGNNFVTMGPDMVDIVLHDPPGSNSYAYIAKGSSFSTTYSHSDVATVTQSLEVIMHLGPEVKTGAGVGFLVMNDVKSKLDIIANIEMEEAWTRNNDYTVTRTFNEQISTSGDPNYIGSDADIYIGQSTNLVYGMMRHLALYPSSQKPADVTSSASTEGFDLFTQEVLAADVEFGTTFSYTQSHLLEHQIPSIKALRDQLITVVTNPADTLSIYFGEDNVKYISLIPASHPDFGEPEKYYVFYKPGIKETDKIDKVLEYNNWIMAWQNRISDNEKAKLDLFDKRTEFDGKKDAQIFENLSYDAGVSLEKSLEVSYEHVETKAFSFKAGAQGGVHTGFGWNSVGFEFNPMIGGYREQGSSDVTTSNNTVTFGYVLAEDESVLFAGKDALSIDVYGPSSDKMQSLMQGTKFPNLSGFTFQRRAGQTSCPYEIADSTLFYTKNDEKQLLNYGTFQIEKPELYIDNLKYASAANIPSGREATFTLQLQNLSEAHLDVTYQIFVDPASNPDGLSISMDGLPLVEPRKILIDYGTEQIKQIKVKQTSLDILDYDNIILGLGSVCESDNYVEASFGVKFIPSSSPVKLVSNSRLANVEGMNSGGKIRFTVSDYERNYKNFGCIRLQYRDAVNENWITLREYVNDKALYPVDSDSKEEITGATCTYDFSYNATTPSDGEYIFRALSVSKIGNEEITTASEEISIVKDTKAPQVLGYPSPVNGILNAGDEISVTFNEPIQSDKLVGGTVGSNFKITGVLNGDIREEPTSGVSFSGSQSAYTEMPVYVSGSFSIETWFKRTNNTAGTLFAYGSGNEYISLGFDATGHAVVSIGNESYTSTLAIDNSDDTWKYIGLAYNRETGAVSVNAYQGTQTLKLFESKTFATAPATQGKLYLGNTAAGNSGFSGAVALLHFYDIARSEAQMSTTKSLTKSGTETNLIGLWELEADEGAYGKDKARSRHLNLNNTSRYIYPLGKSLAFNGTNQYARVSSGTYPFGIYADFTLELWFKGGSQNAATLLSVGTTTYIGFDAEHRLVITTGGSSQILATAGLLDDQWHHLALSVKRNGMARALIDGAVTASFNSEIFGDIGGGYYHLGVKYVQVNDNTYNYVEHFNGNIDELRVWNSALTTDAIVLNKNYSLRGDEAGLKAYYPFEKTQQVNGSVYTVNPLLADVTDGSLTTELFGSASVSDVASPLQLARPVKNVPFTFTASNSKIVLNITEEEYRIDGVTLYVSAENILDMHDNTSSAVNWIAYVNRNALNWNVDLVDIIIEEGETYSFKASISNSGGEKQDYFIEDLPSWLSVSAPQGSLNPLSSKELTFTVAPGVNIGAYEASIVLTGVNNVRKILPVSLKVTGNRPDWSVNPSDYEQSMTVVGQLLIKNLPQEDPDDLLAAFVGNTCVGLVSPKYEAAYQGYLIYLQVWGNASDNGKELTFKIWDASTGNIYPVVELSQNDSPVQLQFAGNALKGAPGAPIKFNALDAVEQSMLLSAGWNWVSFNVASPSLADANELMTGINNGSEIKGLASFSRYETESDYWTNGTLNGAGFSNTQMYMVKMAGANTIALPGSPLDVDNTPISLVGGWNWISYIPQVNETVSEAFAGANPQNGDVVKSQVAFSVYDSNVGWVGTLEYLRPGQGYMYNTSTVRSFKYPKTGIMTRSIEGDPTEGEPLTLNRPYPSLNGEIAPNYESSLSLIGEVRLKSEVLSEDARLIAMVGDEPRGIAEIRKVGDKRLFFLPVYSNTGNETVTFVLENNGREILLREQIQYKPNALVGTTSSPTLLTDANINLKVYPNPFTDQMSVSFEIEEAGTNVRVELISMSGAVLYSTTHAILNAGPQLVSVDNSVVGKLAEGTYVIRVTLSNGETFTNIVIKYQQ